MGNIGSYRHFVIESKLPLGDECVWLYHAPTLNVDFLLRSSSTSLSPNVPTSSLGWPSN